MHDTYEATNGKVVRLINDDILVRMDPLEEKTKGGLVIPETVGDRGDQGIMVTGTVLAYGYVETKKAGKIPIPGVEIGQRVVFIRFYAEQHSNKQIQERIEEGVIRMKAADILFTYDESDADKVLK